MTEREFNKLLMDLQTCTPLGRVNHAEGMAVFDRLAALGFDWRDWPGSEPAPEAVQAS